MVQIAYKKKRKKGYGANRYLKYGAPEKVQV